MVETKLEEHGYRQTSEKTANLGVFLAYGVTEGAARSDAPPPPNVGGGVGMMPGSSGGGSYGMAGSPSGATGAKAYTTQCAIVVVDLQKSRAAGSPVELWRGEAKATGSSNELSQTMPMLIEAVFRHFGEKTPTQVQHTFGDDDMKKLREVR